jgi:hypothetical protein
MFRTVSAQTKSYSGVCRGLLQKPASSLPHVLLCSAEPFSQEADEAPRHLCRDLRFCRGILLHIPLGASLSSGSVRCVGYRDLFRALWGDLSAVFRATGRPTLLQLRQRLFQCLEEC